jgi:hypothetical protein
MRAVLPLLLASALFGAACDDPPGQTSPDPVSPNPITETYVGTLPVGGSGFYSFVVLQPSTVSLMLGSLTGAGTDTVMNTPVAIGLGVPQGFGCQVLVPGTTGPSLTYPVSATMNTGTYCASIADTGGLSGAADFALRIVQNPGQPAEPDPGTSIFESDLTVDGVGVRTFDVSRPGTVTIRLVSVGPPPGVEVSLGVGLPPSDGSGGCRVNASLTTAAPADLSVAAVPGRYCAKIADVGGFTGTARFTIHIIRP